MLTRRLILTNSNPQQGLEYLLIQLHNTITMKKRNNIGSLIYGNYILDYQTNKWISLSINE